MTYRIRPGKPLGILQEELQELNIWNNPAEPAAKSKNTSEIGCPLEDLVGTRDLRRQTVCKRLNVPRDGVVLFWEVVSDGATR